MTIYINGYSSETGNVISIPLDSTIADIARDTFNTSVSSSVPSIPSGKQSIVYDQSSTKITSSGYIYLTTPSTYYRVILNASVAPNLVYTLRDILVGTPPSTGTLPTTPYDASGQVFNMIITNSSGVEITFVFADNTTPGLYTYFAYNGVSSYVIDPLSVLYISGYFSNNTLIYFTQIILTKVNILQYAQIFDNSVKSGYLLPPTTSTTTTTPSATLSGTNTINLSSFVYDEGIYPILYTAPGSLTIHDDISDTYKVIIVIAVVGTGSVDVTLTSSNKPFINTGPNMLPSSLTAGSEWFIGIDNGTIAAFDPSFLNTLVNGAGAIAPILGGIAPFLGPIGGVISSGLNVIAGLGPLIP